MNEGQKQQGGRKISLPSFISIHKSLQILRKVMPEYFTNELVDSLFEQLQTKLIKPELYQIEDTSQSFQFSCFKQTNYNKSSKHIWGRLKQKLACIPAARTAMIESSKRRHSVNGKHKQRNVVFLDRRYSRMNKGKTEVQQTNIMDELDAIWEDEHESYLCNLYLKGKKFSQIRNFFQEEYSDNKDIFILTSLKGKFNKIMRAALFKFRNHIQTYKKRNKYPDVSQFDDTLIKKIMNSKEGRKTREDLLSLYRSHSWNSQRITQIVNQINQLAENPGKYIRDDHNEK